MKTSLHYRLLFFLSLILLLQSCKKETINANNIVKSSAEDDVTAGAGLKKLVLQPGPADGYDTWLTWKQGDPEIYNWNWDTVDITAMYAWTSSGIPIAGRSLIKFTGLSAIPSTAKVIAAKLYMYGIESSPHLPVGNSYYPGSPYPYDNKVAVLRVLENWDPSVVTWFHQPEITTKDSVHIPHSEAQWNWDAAVNVTKLVKKMVAAPATNYGFEFRIANETIYTCMQFSSSDYAIPERRPKLVVIYK